MRHRVAKKHLSRTASHLNAMRRNMAQSLIQHGQIQTTLPKAKEARRFVEKLITIAREGGIDSRRRVEAMLTDRAILNAEHQDKYDQMTDAQRHKVMFARSGRRHRTGVVPASYNKNKIPFVATSVIHKLMTEVAPGYVGRTGGYTRIIRLAKRRIGDNGELAILQLVDPKEAPSSASDKKKSAGLRRSRVNARIAFLEGKKTRRKAGAKKSPAKQVEPAGGGGADDAGTDA